MKTFKLFTLSALSITAASVAITVHAKDCTLRWTAEKSDALFILKHIYTVYPMVRHACQMVTSRVIGKVRVVQVEYPYDLLTVEQGFK